MQDKRSTRKATLRANLCLREGELDRLKVKDIDILEKQAKRTAEPPWRLRERERRQPKNGPCLSYTPKSPPEPEVLHQTPQMFGRICAWCSPTMWSHWQKFAVILVEGLDSAKYRLHFSEQKSRRVHAFCRLIATWFH